jgi:hypothetical protein
MAIVPNRSSCIPFFCEAQHHCRARCTQPWRPRDVEAARLQGTWRGCQCNMRGADEEQWCTVLCSKLKYPFDARSRQTDSTFFLGEFHAAVLVEPLCFLVPAAYSDSVVWKKNTHANFLWWRICVPVLYRPAPCFISPNDNHSFCF